MTWKQKQGLCIPLLKQKIKHRDKTVIEPLGKRIESYLQKLIEFLWGYSVFPCEGASSLRQAIELSYAPQCVYNF